MIRNIILVVLSILANHLMFGQAQRNIQSSLAPKEQSIVLISSYTALGDMPKLQIALNDGLNAGITVNEAKEMLVQLYAYAGFPRSLNALHNLIAVLEERKKKGINDAEGRLPSAIRGNILQVGTANQTKLVGKKVSGHVYEFAPAIDQFLKEHLFGAIFGRDNLDWKTRELVTVAALVAMEGTEPQQRSHFAVGMYNGLTAAQLSEIVAIIENKVNTQRGIIGRQVLQSVLENKPYTVSALSDELLFPKGEKIDNNNFVGNTWLYQMVQADTLNQTAVGSVTFEPGARTKWHLHPAGQILIAIDGVGYYQEKGSTKRILRKGDFVKCPPNIPHWHGASQDQQFIQIAISSSQNGPTQWLQPVSNEEYDK